MNFKTIDPTSLAAVNGGFDLSGIGTFLGEAHNSGVNGASNFGAGGAGFGQLLDGASNPGGFFTQTLGAIGAGFGYLGGVTTSALEQGFQAGGVGWSDLKAGSYTLP
jgi:hypothetical protein